MSRISLFSSSTLSTSSTSSSAWARAVVKAAPLALRGALGNPRRPGPVPLLRPCPASEVEHAAGGATARQQRLPAALPFPFLPTTLIPLRFSVSRAAPNLAQPRSTYVAHSLATAAAAVDWWIKVLT